jgi:hypothetical protein
VEVFKDLVRDDRDFDMIALAIGDEEPNPEAVRYLGQAVMEVRREEFQALDALRRGTSRQSAFVRSAVFPGWGQRYRGYRKRGYMMIGLTAASIAYAVVADNTYRDARDAYDRASEGAEFNNLHTDFTDKSDRADLAIGFVAAAWLLNVIDAASQEANVSGISSGLALAPSSDHDGLQVVYLKRF